MMSRHWRQDTDAVIVSQRHPSQSHVCSLGISFYCKFQQVLNSMPQNSFYL